MLSFRAFFGSSNLFSREQKIRRDSHAFSNYEEALAATNSAGYGETELVNVIVLKTRNFKEEVSGTRFLDLNSTQTLLGLVARGVRNPLRVLDFGGGAGIGFFQTTALLGSEEGLRWNVVETPSMVTAASAQLQSERLKFYSSIESAAKDLEHVDLVICNGSLPYTPNPTASLEELLAVRASQVYISRTPLSEAMKPATFIQTSTLSHNGPGFLPRGFDDCEVQYPVTVSSRREFESRFKHQYSVRFWSREDSSLRGVGPTQNYLYLLDLSLPQSEGN